ncbi:MAG: Repeat family, partial [Verrucomicrobiales bacterium]|nr:Repeat family [Verrucomicrobiales bacterium]
DGAGGTASNSFSVVVSPVNDSPTLDPIGNLSLNQGSLGQVVSLSGISAGPANEAGQGLAIAAVSSNPALMADPFVAYPGFGATASLLVVPQPGQFGSAVITVTVNDGQNANNLLSRSFNVSVNGAPVVSAIADQNINENGVAGPVSFTVGDPESAATSLVVGAASSSNPALVPLSAITLGGSGSNRTVTVTPVSNLSGFSQVTLGVSDGSGNTSSISFAVVVNPVDNGPTLNPIGNLVINEDSAAQVVNLSGISSGVLNQSVLVSATTGNPELIGNLAVTYTSPGASGNLSFTPLSNAYGTGSVTVVVDNGAATNSTILRTFQVVINPVNDAPTLDAISDIVIGEDSGIQVVHLSGITSGAANESQNLTLSAVSSNPGLIANPVVNYTNPNLAGSLNFAPATNGNGTAIITVSVNDGATSNNIATRSFKVTVLPINDAPVISSIPDQVVGEHAIISVPFSISDADTPASGLNVTVSSTNTALLTLSNMTITGTGAERLLTGRLTTNQFGVTLVTVMVNDGLLSSSASFLVMATNANNPPSISQILDQASEQNETVGPIAFTVADLETPAAQLQLRAHSSNQALIPDANIVFGGAGSNRTVTLFALQSQAGNATITVEVEDGGLAIAQTSFTLAVRPGLLLISIARVDSSRINIKFRTIAGKTYTVEYKNDLTDANWTSLGSVNGDGTMQSYDDVAANPVRRFYRVRQQ